MAVPLAILEVSLVVLEDSVMRSSHSRALVLAQKLRSLVSTAFGFTFAEASNVHGRAII